MTFMLTFTVEGDPVAKGRPRFSTRGQFVSTYTPKKTKDYELLIQEAAKQAMGSSDPLETPLKAFIYVTLPIPKSYSKKRFNDCLNGLERPCKKPDIDNYIKLLFDGMNGIIYKDDCQIVALEATKVYGTIGLVQVVVMEQL
jgi:Holliday junction resolvase RusA-like endonuclease